MPRGRPKKPENHTPREEIAHFLQWAERFGYADIPAITALRTDPTAQHITMRSNGPIFHASGWRQ
jgi:hypothetical protein